MRRKRAVLVVAILSALLLSGLAIQAQESKPSDPSKPADVDVTIHHEETSWAVNPVWLAIGGIAVVALIALVVSASRGTRGETTIVKD